MANTSKHAGASKKALDIPDIEKELIIDAGIVDVWNALTLPSAIGSWMGDGSVKADLKIGGAYEFFSGDTTGYFMTIEKPNLLEYSWRMAGWDAGWPDSMVRWELKPHGKKTNVRLTHLNLPTREERDSHEKGWDVYFLEPMKTWLEQDKN